VRCQIHGTELPTFRRIFNAGEEALGLLFFGNIKPVFQQDNAAVYDEVFKRGTILEEVLVLLFGTESHDVLNTGAVVPATVEDDDFAAGRKVPQVALPVELRLLAFGGRRQGDQPEDARAHLLQNALDDSALAAASRPSTTMTMRAFVEETILVDGGRGSPRPPLYHRT